MTKNYQLHSTEQTYPSNVESSILRWPCTTVQPLKFRMLLLLIKS